MKIKTIWIVNNAHFDEKVNKLLEEGWHLAKREVFLDAKDLENSVFYAELVQLDEKAAPPEPQPLDPIEALQQLRAFCDDMQCDNCPLWDFCHRHLPNNEGPADWLLPGEGEPEA